MLAVETITGRSAAPPQRSEKGKSKRAARFKLKRQGDPWEVRIVAADGREQIYKGYRERSARRDARSPGSGVHDSEERRNMRVMRLRLPASP